MTTEPPLINTANANTSSTLSGPVLADIPNPGADLTYPLQFASGGLINTAGSSSDAVGGANGYGNVEFNGLPAASPQDILPICRGKRRLDSLYALNSKLYFVEFPYGEDGGLTPTVLLDELPIPSSRDGIFGLSNLGDEVQLAVSKILRRHLAHVRRPRI